MTLQELTYRNAGLSDLPEIVRLVNSAYRGESSRSGWTTEADLLDGQRTDMNEVEKLISNPGSLILLAELQGMLMGTVHLLHEGDAANIGMLVIRPDLQGRGYGKKLLETAEQTVIGDWGVSKLRMYVISLRTELMAFYRRRGYMQTGSFMPFPMDIRFGIPKTDGLRLALLEKCIIL